MKISWHKSRSEEALVRCPVCGHQTAPPDYPHCSHTLFVFVDPSADDAFFDFMRDDFAAAWKKGRRRIPNRKNIASLDIATSCEVWDVSEFFAYYPTRVVAGYEMTKHELTPSSPADG
jgi:hypothetical protein